MCGDLPGCRLDETEQEVDERGFSRACPADEGDLLTCSYLEIDVFESGCCFIGVSERDVFELKVKSQKSKVGSF